MALQKDKIFAAASKFVQKGQYDKAVKEYQRILAEEPDDERTLQKLGDLYLRMNDPKKAVSMYNRVADRFAMAGFYNKAIAVYRQILNITPLNFDIHLRLAEMYKAIGLIAETIQEYQKVIEYFESQGLVRDALEVTRQVVGIDPSNVPNRIRLAEGYLSLGDAVTARAEFRQAMEYLRANDMEEEFIRVFDRYVQVFLDDKPAILELCQLYLVRGEFRRVLARLQLALKHYPDDTDVLEILARLFVQMDQPEKSVTVYREMARLFAEAGDPGEQVRTLKRVLEIDPRNEDAIAELAELGIEGFGEPAPDFDNVDHLMVEDGGFVDETGAREVEVDLDALPEAPSSGALTASQSDKMLGEAVVFLKYGMSVQAEERLRQILDALPSHEEALRLWRDLHIQRANPIEARRAALRLTQIALGREGLSGAIAALDDANRRITGDSVVMALLSHAVGGDEVALRAGLLGQLGAGADSRPLRAAGLPEGPGEAHLPEMGEFPDDLAASDLGEVDFDERPARGADEEPLILLDEGSRSLKLPGSFGEDAPESPRPALADWDPTAEAAATDEMALFPEVDSPPPLPPPLPPPSSAPPRRPAAPAPSPATASDEEMDFSGLLDDDESSAGRRTADGPVTERMLPVQMPEPTPTDPLERAIHEALQAIRAGRADAGLDELARLMVRHAGDPRVLEAMSEGERLAAEREKAPAPKPAGRRKAEKLDLDALLRGALEDESVNLADALLDEEDLDWGAPGKAEEGLTAEDRADPSRVVQAIRDDRVREIPEEEFHSQYDLGLTYRGMSLLDEAIAAFLICLGHAEGLMDTLVALGVCHGLKGEYDAARVYLLEAARHAPSIRAVEATARYDLAVNLMDRDEPERAMYHFVRIARFDPRFRDVAQQIDRLASQSISPPADDPSDAAIPFSDGAGPN